MPYLVRDKIQFLSNASKILASTLDYNVTLVSIAKLLVENIADFCIIDIVEGEKMNRVVVRTSKKSDQKIANKFFDFPPDPNNKEAIYDAANSGSSILIKKTTNKWLQSVSHIPEEKETVLKLKLKTLIFAPLISRGKVIGVLTIGSGEPGFSYTQDDVLFIDELAGRAALAVDNARLFSEAQQAIQSRDEFISIASHELKTPLTSVLLALQFGLRRLNKKPNKDPEIEKALEMGILQTRRLSALMNDLLNVSVIATGRLKVTKEETELVGLINDILLSFKMENGVLQTIKFKTNEKNITGMWDRVRIEEVITNLLTNAIKYGNKKPVSIEVIKQTRGVMIKVKDRGIGISEEDRKKIFELFKRTKAAKGFKGMGVGLYISNEIVKAHGGEISVESAPRKGTTFIVKLPFA